jgi:hypothetical protein
VPVWHASVAIQTPLGPKPVVTWTTAEWSRAEAMLRQLLRGVGQGKDLMVTTKTTLQMRRRVSGPEFALVGPARDVRRKAQP